MSTFFKNSVSGQETSKNVKKCHILTRTQGAEHGSGVQRFWGLGIQPLVSATRGLGSFLPGTVRAPGKALQGAQRGVFVEKNAKRRWEAPVSRMPPGGATLGLPPSGNPKHLSRLSLTSKGDFYFLGCFN